VLDGPVVWHNSKKRVRRAIPGEKKARGWGCGPPLRGTREKKENQKEERTKGAETGKTIQGEKLNLGKGQGASQGGSNKREKNCEKKK